MTQRSRDPRQELAEKLRARFGTAPNEPSGDQLQSIVDELAPFLVRGRSIADVHWRDAVAKHTASIGKYKTAAVNNADLERLLRDILRGGGR